MSSNPRDYTNHFETGLRSEGGCGINLDCSRFSHKSSNHLSRNRNRGTCRQLHRQSTYQLVVWVAVSCLFLQCRQCSGSDSASSSFQRPPPPPPPRGPQKGTASMNRNENNFDYFYREDQSNDQETSMSVPPGYTNDYPDSEQYSRDQREPDFPSYTSAPEQKKENPSLPIHYEFPAADEGDADRKNAEKLGRDDFYNDDFDYKDDISPATSSARKDLVTRYWSTKKGKLQIQTIVGLVGYGSGTFVAKSVTGGADMIRWTGYFWAAFLIVSTWFRTPMGELSRAVGLSLILVLQRTQRIRREYPTWRYVAASVGILRGGPRDARGRPRGPRPFPPARNPWRYSPRSPRDPDFNMMYTVVSMAMVGSTVGGNMPFIPNWIGALMGAATFAFACTWQNSHRGDLARTMGMRVVRAVTELWEIQADLQIIPKATVVSSQIIDKAMILDRKHRVKDRFLSLANKGYAQASKVAEQIQQQQRGGNKKDGEIGEGDRDRRRSRTEEDIEFQRSYPRENNGSTGERNRRRGDDGEDARFSRSDGRRRRSSGRDDDDPYYSNGRPSSSRDRRPPRYDFDDEDEYRSRDSNYRSREDSKDDNGKDDIEREQTSRGFFFRRK